MDYRRLGHAGLQVSVIGLGTNNFGPRLDYPAAERVVRQAVEVGINFIATSNTYGEGQAEAFIGKAVHGCRAQVLLATKVASNMGDGPNMHGGSRKHILEQVERSLQRLQTDYLDLYQIHFYDPFTPLEETLRTMDTLVQQGKVRYVGCSNWQAWKLAKALGISEFKGLARFETLQAYDSIASRDLERELVPLMEAEKVGLLVWSPLAGGLLSGKYSRTNQKPADSRRSELDIPIVDKERTWRILDAIAPIAQAHGYSAARVSLAWLLAKPVVTSVIIGAKRIDQLHDNLAAMDLELTPDEMAQLDEVSALPPEYPGWVIPFQGADRTDPTKARFGRR